MLLYLGERRKGHPYPVNQEDFCVLEMEKMREALNKIKRRFPILMRDAEVQRSIKAFGVREGKFILCDKVIGRNITDIRPSFRAPFCALAISIIFLLLLLIVYGMLSELHALPGLNLMSLSFSFLLAL